MEFSKTVAKSTILHWSSHYSNVNKLGIKSIQKRAYSFPIVTGVHTFEEVQSPLFNFFLKGWNFNKLRVSRLVGVPIKCLY